ncbi:hypothetical protein AB0H00_30320 [Nocardia sp. NPDC023852]|uniref:hypothetical protein n=1 Tax=Nocardia sp. NPDC023852 TaxID=3154697 RepID=UPI0033F473B7
MATEYNGDPSVLISTAQNAMAVQTELEGYLRSWMSLKDDFAVAVQSDGTGKAIQSTMEIAHTSGVKMARTLQEIIDTLKDTGIKIDSQDLEGAARVQGAVSPSGVNNTVDTNSWQ